MIPAIAYMIGAYVFTRMVDLMSVRLGEAQPLPGRDLVVFLAVIACIITIVMVGLVLTADVEMGSSVLDLQGRS